MYILSGEMLLAYVYTVRWDVTSICIYCQVRCY